MHIQPSELKARLDSASPPKLLDVREREEHEFVALPNSLLIPLAEIPGRLAELEPWRAGEIVVYCHHGVRSQMAIRFLRESGFTRLANLTGGIDRWALEVEPEMPRY